MCFDVALYHQVVHVTSVSSKKRATLFYDNNMEKLRAKLYDIACHLQLASDGVTCEECRDHHGARVGATAVHIALVAWYQRLWYIECLPINPVAVFAISERFAYPWKIRLTNETKIEENRTEGEKERGGDGNEAKGKEDFPNSHSVIFLHPFCFLNSFCVSLPPSLPPSPLPPHPSPLPPHPSPLPPHPSPLPPHPYLPPPSPLTPPPSPLTRHPSPLTPPPSLPVEYKKDCKEEDPKCLFQQHIPQSFLNLQDKIRKTIATFREDNRVPIMEEGEFRLLPTLSENDSCSTLCRESTVASVHVHVVMRDEK